MRWTLRSQRYPTLLLRPERIEAGFLQLLLEIPWRTFDLTCLDVAASYQTISLPIKNKLPSQLHHPRRGHRDVKTAIHYQHRNWKSCGLRSITLRQHLK